jgi:regulatory protein YycI of two-component signal transduction system YycFG
MKKKTIIIIVVILIVIGVIIWLYLKNKKKATTTAAVAASATPIAANLPADTTVIVKSAQADATTPILQTSAGRFTRVLEDGSQHKAILRYDPATIPINVGNSVVISSGPYAGTFKVWYIYEGSRSGEPTVRNLYIDTPYNGDVSGTFTKV